MKLANRTLLPIVVTLLLLGPGRGLAEVTTQDNLNVNGGDCKSVCDNYHNATSDQALSNLCGPVPTAGSPPATASIRNAQGEFKTYGECAKAVTAEWTNIGQHCDAWALYGKAITHETLTAAIYTASTGICTAACLYPMIAFGCNVASMGSATADLVATIVLLTSDDRKGYLHWQDVVFGGLSTAGGLTAGVMTTADVLKNQTLEKDNSCLLAGALAAVAGLKWINLLVDKDKEKDACGVVKGFVGGNATSMLPPADKSVLPGGASGKSVAGSGSSGGTTGTGAREGFSSLDAINLADMSNPLTKAAMSDSGGELLKALPNTTDLAKNFAEATKGMTIQDVARRLSAGEGPGSILASAGLVPPDRAEKLAEIDDMAKKGMFHLKDSPAVVMTSAGGGKKSGGGASPLLLDFGMRTQAGVTGSAHAEAKFDKKTEILTEGDIWHQGYGGSIFQLMSQKLGTVKDRVEQAEWQTPLNRALLGLPAKK